MISNTNTNQYQSNTSITMFSGITTIPYHYMLYSGIGIGTILLKQYQITREKYKMNTKHIYNNHNNYHNNHNYNNYNNGCDSCNHRHHNNHILIKENENEL
jgi:hypothetical protein